MDVIAGHVWRNLKHDAIIIGSYFDGAHKIAAMTIIDSVLVGPSVKLTSGLGSPMWLLTRFKGVDKYEVAISTTGPLTGYGTFIEITGPTLPIWAGFGAFGWDGSLSTTEDFDYDDAKLFEPNSIRPFSWQAWRDTGLGGTYDLIGAQLQLEKQKPAHTEAGAITDKDGIKLSPTGTGRLGIDPLYPLNPIIS